MSEFFSWRRSTRTQGQGQCVEVGFAENAVGVRDSKNRPAGHLAVELAQWRAFLKRIKGECGQR
ncbi:hypothetical protein FHR84_003277 [Actinopolyspora biskrensis]|uniref:DUF397 domain-containing protein n=1 Tax=Actinopolyspora biskrensis TaxID=1470178 RepID=A0A852Z0C1_9ACTN|nr:DUF397 domain-containing protein [Actinopolyspora biskrensis]NYH79928.1 hypothetical protein [Actinopolyspora biskrensis]